MQDVRFHSRSPVHLHQLPIAARICGRPFHPVRGGSGTLSQHHHRHTGNKADQNTEGKDNHRGHVGH
jgi:hypothetical protein